MGDIREHSAAMENPMEKHKSDKYLQQEDTGCFATGTRV